MSTTRSYQLIPRDRRAGCRGVRTRWVEFPVVTTPCAIPVEEIKLEWGGFRSLDDCRNNAIVDGGSLLHLDSDMSGAANDGEVDSLSAASDANDEVEGGRC